MNQETATQRVNQSEIRIHQSLVIIGLLMGFITDRWEWVVAQSAVFLLTSLIPNWGLYVLFYQKVLRPLEILKPDIRTDVPQAHRFAMSIGFLVTGFSSYQIYSGNTLLGWGLVWLVVILAAVALAGWCAGCYSYYKLNRMGVGGFFKYSSLKGTFPGVRPGK